MTTGRVTARVVVWMLLPVFIATGVVAFQGKRPASGGGISFTDVTRESGVTEQAGLAGKHYSVGCAAADYDNDGKVDLLVLNYGQNELFHNDGNGKFTEVSRKAGLTDAGFSLSAVWYDYNKDGPRHR